MSSIAWQRETRDNTAASVMGKYRENLEMRILLLILFASFSDFPILIDSAMIVIAEQNRDGDDRV